MSVTDRRITFKLGAQDHVARDVEGRVQFVALTTGEIMQGILHAFGLDVDDQNFQDTPRRWLSYLSHYTQPYDPATDLGRVFHDMIDPSKEAPTDLYRHAMVVQTGIPYRAVCAHHLLPVLGTARVGYIPQRKVVGLSKLSRLVYGFSHASPSLQEDVTSKVTDALMEHLGPLGAMCVISAEHGCMACRGVEEAAVSTVTSSVRGVFETDVNARQEFLRLCNF